MTTEFRKDEKTAPVQTLDEILAQLDFSSWAIVMAGTTNELTVAAVKAGKQVLTTLQLVDDSPMFDVVDESAVVYATARGAEMVGMRVLEDGSLVPNPDAAYAITESTREFLRSTVAQALEEGWSAQQLKQVARENYAFSSDRALTIARTELNNAHSAGALAAAKASGVVKTKTWTLGSEHDDASECDCGDNADQGPIPIDEDFQSGDSCPSAHPHCVCICVYGIESAAGSEESDDEDDSEAA